MQGGIFLVQSGGRLIELAEQPYEAEIILQRLLADYPNILSGEQMNPTSPRRWLLVGREAAIPGEEGGGGRWALDHLFLDQDAVPTLVEVKRSSDTRTRREVAGQMLDYAANAIVYWPVETIREQFLQTCSSSGSDPEQILGSFLGPGAETGEFWQSVKQNLQAGRIRLVFVADAIPPELRRIVEFLNGQMDPAEVVAVEVRQFVGEGLRALVPQVVGQTAVAQQVKAAVRPAGKRKWDEVTFFEEIVKRRGSEEAAVAQDVLNWATNAGLRIWWGQGANDGSFFPMVDLPSGNEWTVSVWTYGRVEIQFEQLARPRSPFASETRRIELLRRLDNVPGISIPPTAIARRPSIPLSQLIEKDVQLQLLDVLGWLVTELQTASAEEAAPENW